MDPYLEHPDLWPDVHNRLITMMANALTSQVRPRYYVAIEKRVYLTVSENALIGRPDVTIVDYSEEPPWPRIGESLATYRPFLITLPISTPDEIRETYLEVRETAGGQVITVIELLSPANKRPNSEGYTQYLKKRVDILRSRTNLVEVDLLRGGQPLPIVGELPASDYRFIISRHWQRPQAHLYAFNLRETIPICSVPLQKDESERDLNLQELLHNLYEQAGYDLRINYKAEPSPALAPLEADWADELLRRGGLRG
jgi:hypothetical protein